MKPVDVLAALTDAQVSLHGVARSWSHQEATARAYEDEARRIGEVRAAVAELIAASRQLAEAHAYYSHESESPVLFRINSALAKVTP